MKAKQVFLVSLNDYDSEEIKEELSSEEDLLDNIDRKMRFEKLNKSLNNDIRDCFSWLIQGFSQREIADKLNTCTATVRENYFQKIKRAAIKTGFVTE
jgi:FixJ family two-component response regulator